MALITYHQTLITFVLFFSFPLWINSPQITQIHTDSHRFINLIISKIKSVSICVICGESYSFLFRFEPKKGSLLTAPYIPFLHWSKGKVSWDSGHDDLQSERVERCASIRGAVQAAMLFALRCECRMADCRHPNLLHNRYRWSVGYDWGNALRLFPVGGHGESHRHESRRSDSRCHWSRGGECDRGSNLRSSGPRPEAWPSSE